MMTETLDPHPTEWGEMRKLGHRMVDDMMEYLATLRDRPVWRPMPDEVRDRFDAPVPQDPEGAEAAYRDFVDNVLPYPHGNLHPRHWGWVNGQGTPVGALADFLAATLNTNAAGGDNAATLVELQVLSWLKQMLGYPDDAGGHLVSGGSVANLVGLAAALHSKAEVDVATEGLGAVSRRMVLYASDQTHSSVLKAVRLLGLGTDALRSIPVDDRFAIDLPALGFAIARDRAAGLHPFCIVGNAGTTNTGAFDDLDVLADVAQAEHMWLHVDGAFGALAALSPKTTALTTGMERADSLAFDLHKWMYLPYDVGCVLVRDEPVHRKVFTVEADYLGRLSGGLTGTASWFSDYGIQLSRGFRALKVWMSLKAHGVRKHARLIEQNVQHARYLGRLVRESPHLELLAPVTLNVVCFRFNPAAQRASGSTAVGLRDTNRIERRATAPYLAPEQDIGSVEMQHGSLGNGLPDVALNALNEQLLIQLQERGIAAPSHTVINGNFVIRVSNTNHRSTAEDFGVLVEEVVRLGHELVAHEKELECSAR